MKRTMKLTALILVLAGAAALIMSFNSGAQAPQEEPTEESNMIKLYSVEKKDYVQVPKIEKTEEEWKSLLSKEQFHVTRKQGTERPFSYKELKSDHKGVYKCVCCGTDLFLSDHKFDSGTGWPSFWQPIAKENVAEKDDRSLFMKRIEVHCPRCGCHLGHVFPDGPEPTGLRYCINGAALKFVGKE